MLTEGCIFMCVQLCMQDCSLWKLPPIIHAMEVWEEITVEISPMP